MIGAIVFARTFSTRLPSKVLIKIHKKSILEHVVNRLQHSKYLEKIVIATTTKTRDDTIIDIAKNLSVDFFRGSESDVLDRCYKAATKFSLDPIIRITADDPFKDHLLIDKAILLYNDHKEKVDLVCNTLKPTFPEGLDVEIINYNTLKKLWKIVKNPEDREHLTKYILDHENDFKIINFENPQNLSHIRITLDTKEDLQLIKEIYDHFHSSKSTFNWTDIITFLQSNPTLLEINKNIKKSGRYLND